MSLPEKRRGVAQAAPGLFKAPRVQRMSLHPMQTQKSLGMALPLLVNAHSHRALTAYNRSL